MRRSATAGRGRDDLPRAVPRAVPRDRVRGDVRVRVDVPGVLPTPGRLAPCRADVGMLAHRHRRRGAASVVGRHHALPQLAHQGETMTMPDKEQQVVPPESRAERGRHATPLIESNSNAH